MGKIDVCDETDPNVLLNVFYVSRTLLAENSSYFANILNHLRYTSDLLEVKLRDFRPDTFAGWLDVLYQGTLARRHPYGLTFFEMKEYIGLAHFLGSESLENELMDSVQEVSEGEVHLEYLRRLEKNGLDSSPLADFVIECLAHQIVTTSWAAFATDMRDMADGFNTNATLDNFISNDRNLANFNRLLAKVDELNKDKDQQVLVHPKARRDCKWHQHANDEARAECPRNKKISSNENGNNNSTEVNGSGEGEP